MDNDKLQEFSFDDGETWKTLVCKEQIHEAVIENIPEGEIAILRDESGNEIISIIIPKEYIGKVYQIRINGKVYTNAK